MNITKTRTITRKKLRELYNTYERKMVCKMLEITSAKLAELLKEAGIKLKGKGNRRPKSKLNLH